MTTYRHTQKGPLAVAILAVAWSGALWLALLTAHPIAIVVTVLMGCLLWLFSSLTVVLRDGVLEVFFGPGWIHRRIPLDRIVDVQAVRTPWHCGWGIRLIPHGWMWNISGSGGVELTFDDGGRFRIGTDEPDLLAEVLRGAL